MKNIVITGCSKGIGNAILSRLVAMTEYRIFAVTKNYQNICLESDAVKVISCDLKDKEDVENAIEVIQKLSGGVDILINNAGIGSFNDIENIKFDQWQQILAVNLTAPYLFIRSFITGMKERNFGKIINIASDASFLAFAQGAAYCASKFGLRGMAECIREETKTMNITVTNICPGRVDTYFNGKKPGDRPLSLKADDIASQVEHVLKQPDYCQIESISLRSVLE